MRHTKPERIYSDQYSPIYARKLVKFNVKRYWVGVALALSTMCKLSFDCYHGYSGVNSIYINAKWRIYEALT